MTNGAVFQMIFALSTHRRESLLYGIVRCMDGTLLWSCNLVDTYYWLVEGFRTVTRMLIEPRSCPGDVSIHSTDAKIETSFRKWRQRRQKSSWENPVIFYILHIQFWFHSIWTHFLSRQLYNFLKLIFTFWVSYHHMSNLRRSQKSSRPTWQYSYPCEV